MHVRRSTLCMHVTFHLLRAPKSVFQDMQMSCVGAAEFWSYCCAFYKRILHNFAVSRIHSPHHSCTLEVQLHTALRFYTCGPEATTSSKSSLQTCFSMSSTSTQPHSKHPDSRHKQAHTTCAETGSYVRGRQRRRLACRRRAHQRDI
jgi:hypothetical protein